MGKRRIGWILLVWLLAVVAVPTALANDVLEMHQMCIGCADGYLIRVGGQTILIDGGNAQPINPNNEVAEYLHAAGVTRLDVCIVTHWHLDHCMHLNNLLAEFGDERTVVYGPSDNVPDTVSNPMVSIQMAPLSAGTYRQLLPGEQLRIGTEETYVTIDCIGPAKLQQKGACNQDSLNFIMGYGERKILFTGDFAVSKAIAGQYAELCAGVDAVKFPHHGIEPYSLSWAAARVLQPEYVLVPGVGNKYKIWNFFDSWGVKFPRENVLSNADGHVVILTDGGEYFEVRTQQDPQEYAHNGTQS